MTIKLDPTSDIAAVLVWASPAEVEALGGSIAGSNFEGADGDKMYAAVSRPWDDGLTAAENDVGVDAAWTQCIAEIEAAGLDWEEGDGCG